MKETTVKINKAKICLWEDKQNWQAFSQTHQERKKNQTNKSRNEKEEVTIDNADIQRIIRDNFIIYYEQLNGNKIDNLEEVDRFLEKSYLLRLKRKK